MNGTGLDVRLAAAGGGPLLLAGAKLWFKSSVPSGRAGGPTLVLAEGLGTGRGLVWMGVRCCSGQNRSCVVGPTPAAAASNGEAGLRL